MNFVYGRFFGILILTKTNAETAGILPAVVAGWQPTARRWQAID